MAALFVLFAIYALGSGNFGWAFVFGFFALLASD